MVQAGVPAMGMVPGQPWGMRLFPRCLHTDAEDEQIRNHVAENGTTKWRHIAKQLSLVRPVSEKAVKMRWSRIR